MRGRRRRSVGGWVRNVEARVNNSARRAASASRRRRAGEGGGEGKWCWRWWLGGEGGETRAVGKPPSHAAGPGEKRANDYSSCTRPTAADDHTLSQRRARQRVDCRRHVIIICPGNCKVVGKFPRGRALDKVAFCNNRRPRRFIIIYTVRRLILY